jgi:hypothetical protein
MESIDLRPLSLGELLDRTFRLYRNHFFLFAGIMAIPAALLIPINTASFHYQGAQINGTIASPGKPLSLPSFGVLVGAAVGLLIAIIVFGTIYSVAIAAASTAVADVYLGHTATIRASYRSIHGRFWRLIGVVGNVFVRILGLMLIPLLAIGGGAAWAGYAVGGSTSSPSFVVITAFGALVAGLASVALYVVIALRYALSVPALMLEDLGVLGTIRRSVFLTKGRRGHIFLVLLLAGIIATVGVYVFEMPFTIALLVTTLEGHASPWVAFAAAVSGAVGSAVTGPISMIAIVLLYYDSRIRKEAFDLQFMLASLESPEAAGAL